MASSGGPTVALIWLLWFATVGGYFVITLALPLTQAGLPLTPSNSSNSNSTGGNSTVNGTSVNLDETASNVYDSDVKSPAIHYDDEGDGDSAADAGSSTNTQTQQPSGGTNPPNLTPSGNSNPSDVVPLVSSPAVSLHSCGCPSKPTGSMKCNIERDWTIDVAVTQPVIEDNTLALNAGDSEYFSFQRQVALRSTQYMVSGNFELSMINTAFTNATLVGFTAALERRLLGSNGWEILQTGISMRTHPVSCTTPLPDCLLKDTYHVSKSAVLEMRDAKGNSFDGSSGLVITPTIDNDKDGARDEDGPEFPNCLGFVGQDDDRDGKVDEDGACSDRVSGNVHYNFALTKEEYQPSRTHRIAISAVFASKEKRSTTVTCNNDKPVSCGNDNLYYHLSRINLQVAPPLTCTASDCECINIEHPLAAPSILPTVSTSNASRVSIKMDATPSKPTLSQYCASSVKHYPNSTWSELTGQVSCANTDSASPSDEVMILGDIKAQCQGNPKVILKDFANFGIRCAAASVTGNALPTNGPKHPIGDICTYPASTWALASTQGCDFEAPCGHSWGSPGLKPACFIQCLADKKQNLEIDSKLSINSNNVWQSLSEIVHDHDGDTNAATLSEKLIFNGASTDFHTSAGRLALELGAAILNDKGLTTSGDTISYQALRFNKPSPLCQQVPSGVAGASPSELLTYAKARACFDGKQGDWQGHYNSVVSTPGPILNGTTFLSPTQVADALAIFNNAFAYCQSNSALAKCLA